MCEIIFRVHDKVNPDPYKDCKCFKAGDVIVVKPDGWPWASEELTNPIWRILKLPNVSVSAAEAFLGPELDTDPAHPSRMLRRRGFLLDLASSNWSKPVQTWLADDTRATPFRSVNISESTLLSMKIAKTPLQDPGTL